MNVYETKKVNMKHTGDRSLLVAERWLQVH